MRLPTTMLASMLVLFSSCMALAQSKKPDSDGVLARVSYDVGASVIDWGTQEGYPQACFALYRGEYYQMSRMTEHGTETFQGTLSRAQLLGLGKMLKNLDFESKAGGIVRGGSERFVAEMIRKDQTIRYVWMNPDHQNPFPSSAVRIIDWLQDFDDKGASPLTLREASEDSICPSLSDSPFQPLNTGFAQ